MRLKITFSGDLEACRVAKAGIEGVLGSPDYCYSGVGERLRPLIKSPHVYGRSKERFGAGSYKVTLHYLGGPNWEADELGNRLQAVAGVRPADVGRSVEILIKL